MRLKYSVSVWKHRKSANQVFPKYWLSPNPSWISSGYLSLANPKLYQPLREVLVGSIFKIILVDASVDFLDLNDTIKLSALWSEGSKVSDLQAIEFFIILVWLGELNK